MRPSILFFINTLDFGGAERVVSQLLQQLNDDFDLHLALYDDIIKYPIPKEVKIFNLKENIHKGGMATLMRLPVLARKVAGYCKENDIRLCVSFLNRPSYINAMMRFLWGYKGRSIMCERSHQSTILQFIGGGSGMYRFITKKLIRWSYNKADLVLANSMLSRQDLLETFGIKKPVEVIYNPIDIAGITNKANEPLEDITEGRFVFLTTGNFRIEKNFDLLVRAFARLNHLSARLVLVGGGILEPELKRTAAALGISDRVFFTRFQSNPFNYIKQADCFVLSSHTEGFPNVLLEALALGKAVIATDCKSGPREILAPSSDTFKQVTGDFEVVEFGILTPNNDEEQLAKAMTRMYEDAALRKRYTDAAVKRAQDFDVNIILPDFRKVFSDQLSSTGKK